MSLNQTSPAEYFFEKVELNTGEVLYSDISGDYLFAGDMYATSPGGLTNLSASARLTRALDRSLHIRRRNDRVHADTVKASITVFTDVDCTYCRALHGDLEELMAYGIEVRYKHLAGRRRPPTTR